MSFKLSAHFQSAHDIVAAALSGGSALAATGSSPGLANLPNTSVDGHEESPEKLSLKARLKLFEKEIEQQGAAPGNCENNSRPLLMFHFEWSFMLVFIDSVSF